MRSTPTLALLASLALSSCDGCTQAETEETPRPPKAGLTAEEINGMLDNGHDRLHAIFEDRGLTEEEDTATYFDPLEGQAPATK